MLREEGVPVIEADGVGHRLLEGDVSVRRAVAAAFGPEVIVDGGLTREKLAAVAFSEGAALARLNAILHPAIIQTIQEECAGLAARGHPAAVVEAALIGEGERREPWLQGLILVLAETELRVKRLVKFRNMAEAEARKRIAAQTEPRMKMRVADWVIYNDGDLKSLKKQVSALVVKLRLPGEGQIPGPAE